MPGTYELIASASPNGVTQVTFNSIPQTYTDLKLIIEGKSNQAGTGYNGMRMTINNDSSTAYWYQQLGTNATTTITIDYNYTYQYISVCEMAQASQSVAGFAEVDINDYTSSSKYRTVLYRGGTDQQTEIGVGTYPSTTAVSRLDFVRDGSNTFRSGTNIKIYGIKRA